MGSNTTNISKTQTGWSKTTNQPETHQNKIKKPNTSKDTGPHPDPNKIGTKNKPKWRTKKGKVDLQNTISNLGETIEKIDQKMDRLDKSKESIDKETISNTWNSGNTFNNPTIPVIVLEESSQNNEQNNRDSCFVHH